MGGSPQAEGAPPPGDGAPAPFGAPAALRVCIDLDAGGDPERRALELELAQDVRRLGGEVVPPGELAAGPLAFAVVGHLEQPLAAAARGLGVPCASDWWLDACIEAARVLPLSASLLFEPQRGPGGIPGMEDVLVCATGYTGAARAEVKELCARAGARYSGTLSRENTHLLCFDHQGDKYTMAQKWRAQSLQARPEGPAAPLVVNHRWIEDCNRAWRAVEENRYEALSGREAAAQPPVPFEELAGTVAETDEEEGVEPEVVVPCSAPDSGRTSEGARRAERGGGGEPPLPAEHWEPDDDGSDGAAVGEALSKPPEATAESEEEEEVEVEEEAEEDEEEEEDGEEGTGNDRGSPQRKKRRTFAVQPSPTPRRVAALQPRKPPRLLSLSGMHTWQKDYCTPMARHLGLRLERTREHQWRPHITHIVTSQVRRCEKILAGLAAGVWILGSTWLEESHSEGQVLPEDRFEAVEPAGDLFGPGALAHWRRRRAERGEGAFAGLRVGLHGKFRGGPKRPSAATLRSILQAGGAEVVSANASGALDFVVVPEEVTKPPPAIKALAEAGVPIVAGGYITDWVAFPGTLLEGHFLFGTSASPALLEAQRARGELR